MEKEEGKVDKKQAITILQVLINEYGKRYLEEGEFIITVAEKGGQWNLFLWPDTTDLNHVENDLKLALMQINQLKVYREREEEEAKAEKLRKQYVA